jgi:hypothetical protein
MHKINVPRLKIHFLFFLSALQCNFYCSKEIQTENILSEDSLSIHRDGVGGLYINNPISDINKFYSGFDIKYVEDYGYFILDDEELLLNVYSKNDSIISGIFIHSSRFSLKNKIRVGQNMSIIKDEFSDFFLEIDDLTLEEYFAPEDLQTYNDEGSVKQICFFIYFKPEKGKFIGDYKSFQPDERTNNFINEGILDHILIYNPH